MKILVPFASILASATVLSTACGGGDNALFATTGGSAGSTADASTDSGGQSGSGGNAGVGGSGGQGGSSGMAGSGTGGTAGVGGTAGAGGTSGAGGTAGTGGSAGCTKGCDDAIGCTIDSCVQGSCVHAPGTCATGEYCDLVKGCVKAPICSTEAQCTAVWGSDPCKSNVHCEGASATCKFTLLDKDADTHAPVVCGGDDCDDADPLSHPGAAETCDGKDNNCNGSVDESATCPGLQVCEGGGCACPPANQCGGECVDKTTDKNHCGACFNQCAPTGTCVNSTCKCPGTLTACNGACVDINTNNDNCGACGTHCQVGNCVGGACPVCKPGGLLILLDVSGSMSTTLQSSSRLAVELEVIKAFAQEPASAGLSVGVEYYPRIAGVSQCDTSYYAIPDVAIAVLPANANAIINSTVGIVAGGNSVTSPVLDAAITTTRTWENANPGRKGAVVMINDGGIGNGCPADTAAIATALATAGYTGTPSVASFIIGIDTPVALDLQVWNDVPSSGGGKLYSTGTTGYTAILDALHTIRSSYLCP